jgi:hypothetical protein
MFVKGISGAPALMETRVITIVAAAGFRVEL